METIERSKTDHDQELIEECVERLRKMPDVREELVEKIPKTPRNKGTALRILEEQLGL